MSFLCLPPDCRFIGFGENGYPPLLAECPDPPAGLTAEEDKPDSRALLHS